MRALSGPAPESEAAAERLHALLLRAARKFALLEAAATIRRRAWCDREVALDVEGWARLPDVRQPTR